MRLFHFRDDVPVADHNTAQRDQLLDMVRTKLTNAEDLAEVVRSHLDDMIVAVLVVVHVEVVVLVVGTTPNVVHVELFVDLRHDEIEDGNDVGGVVLNLPVQHLIELENMVAINVEHSRVQFPHLLQSHDVVGGFLELLVVLVVAVVPDLLKVVDEVFEFHLHIVSIDVGTPEDLGVGADFVSPLQLYIVHHTGR